MSKICHIHRIPVHIFPVIQEYLLSVDYLLLLNSSKSVFQEVKQESRQICLNENESTKFCTNEEFRNEILLKVKHPEFQLKIVINSIDLSIVPEILNTRFLSLVLNYSIEIGDYFGSLSIKNIVMTHNQNIVFFPLRNPFLEHLVISDFQNLSDISNLAHLQSIKLEKCPAISDVSCLNNVHCLALRHCENVVEVSELGNICKLSIHYCNKIKNISKLTNNKHLSIFHCAGIISGFIPLTKSQCVETNHIKAYPSSMLFMNTKVTKEILFENYSDKKIYLPKSLRKLRLRDSNIVETANFSILQSVHLHNCSGLAKLEGFSSISFISIENCSSLSNITDLVNSDGESKVRRIILSNCSSITNFTSLKNIPAVTIEACPYFENGYDVENVTELTIDSCPRFSDPSMLQGCKVLELKSLRAVHTLKGLKDVPKVVIESVGIHSYEGLGNNLSIITNLDERLWKDFSSASNYQQIGELDNGSTFYMLKNTHRFSS